MFYMFYKLVSFLRNSLSNPSLRWSPLLRLEARFLVSAGLQVAADSLKIHKFKKHEDV